LRAIFEFFGVLFFVLLCGKNKLSDLLTVERYLAIKVGYYIYFRFAIDKVFCCL